MKRKYNNYCPKLKKNCIYLKCMACNFNSTRSLRHFNCKEIDYMIKNERITNVYDNHKSDIVLFCSEYDKKIFEKFEVDNENILKYKMKYGYQK